MVTTLGQDFANRASHSFWLSFIFDILFDDAAAAATVFMVHSKWENFPLQTYVVQSGRKKMV